MPELFSLERGDTPLVVSIPHVGAWIPPSLRHLYTDEALAVADTNWHLDRLCAFVREPGATLIGARVSRYVIGTGRPTMKAAIRVRRRRACTARKRSAANPSTGLCAPDAAERAARVAQWWQPYHDALAAELARLRERHANVLLWEAHSIASVLPRLFDDKLPDLNLGTQDGRTCAGAVQRAAVDAMQASPFTSVANGRFKGGYITRNYGAPERGIHAVQLEMCQSTYMNERAPFDYAVERAEAMQPTLARMVGAALDAVRALAPTSALS
ncbi:N-formylglutamate amidohydrolase [Paraburkholderia mimosarum]|uniref:N-formylglutamate amidohydrolase n=1 Tax=Paraburkholderia mimosarum TaxID=312026 RepID=UPI0003FECEA3|nr:N-formylglutamate amidohydrolase [Paraburkholderia mimosarum]